jgi:hypothetical protein
MSMVPAIQNLLVDTTNYTAKNGNLHDQFKVTFGPHPMLNNCSMTRTELDTPYNDYMKSTWLQYSGVFPDGAHFKLLVSTRNVPICKYILVMYVGDELEQDHVGNYYIY